MKDFKKYYIVHEAPEVVYRALTNPAVIRLWSGDEVVMEAVPDTEFSLWDGAIVGRNIAFEETKKITQESYFGEQEAPSIVTIILHEHKQGTSVEVRHTNIPDEDYDDIVDGWNTQYMGAVVDFFENE